MRSTLLVPHAGQGVRHAAVGGHLHAFDALGLQAGPRPAAGLVRAEDLVNGGGRRLDLLDLRLHLPLQLHQGYLLGAPVHDDVREERGAGERHSLSASDLRYRAHEVAGEAVLAEYWLHTHAVARDAEGGHPPGDVQRVPPLGITVREAVARGLQAVRWRVRDEHGDLSRVRAPGQAQRVTECRGDCFRAIATAVGRHRAHVPEHLLLTARERKALRDVGAVLRRVVSVADESEAHVSLVLLGDPVHDALDVLLRGVDV
mmetsp:Transcript_42907/g.133988  ORF Transcript_42907/g.133988 Transcript_42907/m.133988 type:complete len:259 (-) Transcript_42907:337-1113(-)